jgi:hypothetical protein
MSHLQEYGDFIVSLLNRHGPTEEDDAAVHRVVNAVYQDLHSGRLTLQDIRFLRSKFSYTLGSCQTLQGHALAKPYGYPGDFELIDKIYTRYVNSQPQLVRWDQFFHRLDACQAVRNRKDWFLERLRHKSANGGRPADVLIVGSGPGRDVLEFLQANPVAARFDCIELDPKAIEYSRRLCHPVLDHVHFVQRSVLRYRTHTRYNVIWSAGLFDYFKDRVFERAVAHLFGLLADGGELIIGNFAAANSSQAFMELVSDWRLTLRSPPQLERLAAGAGIEARNVQVDQEPAGVNLFLRICR